MSVTRKLPRFLTCIFCVLGKNNIRYFTFPMRKAVFSILVPLVLAGCNGSANITGDPAQEPQTDIDRFAACLTETGAVFYGTEWCPHCKKQKELFGESLAFVNYIDCDKKSTACTAAGVTGYPPGRSAIRNWSAPSRSPHWATLPVVC